VVHTVEVTASTLYEAVALGLKQIRGNEWLVGIPDAPDTVKVSVKRRVAHPSARHRTSLKHDSNSRGAASLSFLKGCGF